ncbi:MAG TPA: riboflavin synthase, partial [Acidimicrobiia bacterium]|nr:riboflavin synthase [Acidimicrobiia bacterium]
MFTGIVEELGTVRAITPNAGGARLEIVAKLVLDDAELGASIAVNGCCLTVVELLDDGWAADAVTETLDRTALGALAPG